MAASKKTNRQSTRRDGIPTRKTEHDTAKGVHVVIECTDCGLDREPNHADDTPPSVKEALNGIRERMMTTSEADAVLAQHVKGYVAPIPKMAEGDLFPEFLICPKCGEIEGGYKHAMKCIEGFSRRPTTIIAGPASGDPIEPRHTNECRDDEGKFSNSQKLTDERAARAKAVADLRAEYEKKLDDKFFRQITECAEKFGLTGAAKLFFLIVAGGAGITSVYWICSQALAP